MAHHPLAPDWLLEPDDANALDPRLWSGSVRRTGDGELEVAGMSVSELASRYGTPLYVMDEADVRARAAEVMSAYSREFDRIGSGTTVYYAAKAFFSTDVARWVTEAGLHIDVCTGGELAVALAAGVDPSLLAFHGNNKSLTEIDRAVVLGVDVIVIDSITEIGRVADAATRHGRVQRVRLRVNSGVHAHTHEYLATAREDQKFGITIEDAPSAVSAIRSHESLDFLGLHSHIGSQIFGSDAFAEAASRLLTLHRSLLADGPVPELNLGGGFGIAYTSVDDPMPFAESARRMADIVAAEAERLDIAVPLIAIEPGRSIVGPSGFTLYEVGTIKDVAVSTGDATRPSTAVRKYVSVDGGMSDNVRPALYGADYSVRIASRTSAAAPALVRVVGKHCESGDIVVHADYLPEDVQPGDLLAVPATGAYCWSLASNYNHVGRPAVIAVVDGESRVLVHGETEDDLLARDAGVVRTVRTEPDSEGAGATTTGWDDTDGGLTGDDLRADAVDADESVYDQVENGHS